MKRLRFFSRPHLKDARMHRTPSAVAVATLTLGSQLAVPAVGLAAAAIPVAQTASTGKLYVGSTTTMKWGPVSVRIRVTNHKIVNVGATLPTHRNRSKEINDRAAPVLRREVLAAQSWHINAVSGATMTSDAYASSLRSAMAKAGL
jgi:uncharacterized protein with FMN-binding domain